VVSFEPEISLPEGKHHPFSCSEKIGGYFKQENSFPAENHHLFPASSKTGGSDCKKECSGQEKRPPIFFLERKRWLLKQNL